MNALINVIKAKQKLMFENEGRLLKKSFFGLLILSLAFQSGSFGEIVRQSMIDAYLQVSVFVGFTLIVFIGLDSLTNFNVDSFLEKTKTRHIIDCLHNIGSITECFLPPALFFPIFLAANNRFRRRRGPEDFTRLLAYTVRTL